MLLNSRTWFMWWRLPKWGYFTWVHKNVGGKGFPQNHRNFNFFLHFRTLWYLPSWFCWNRFLETLWNQFSNYSCKTADAWTGILRDGNCVKTFRFWTELRLKHHFSVTSGLETLSSYESKTERFNTETTPENPCSSICLFEKKDRECSRVLSFFSSSPEQTIDELQN